jgi:ERCC4-type nuclease
MSNLVSNQFNNPENQIDLDSPISGLEPSSGTPNGTPEYDNPYVNIPNQDQEKAVNSLFTVLVDSLEQQPYTFQNVVGDFRNDYSPIRVPTLRKRLPVGDYAISGVPGICIERKSKADLFGSFANKEKRDNFVERLRKIQEGYEYGAVMIECYISEIINDPYAYSSLNPKTIIRSILSWEQQFPLVHFHFAEDRDMAENLTYRILEKFYQHKIEPRYKHHNKPIESAVEAFRQGQLARMASEEFELPYCKGNALRVMFQKGWCFAATHFYEGNLGQLYEPGSTPTSTPKEKAKAKKEAEKFKPLPGQKVLEFADPTDELRQLVGQQFATSVKKKK